METELPENNTPIHDDIYNESNVNAMIEIDAYNREFAFENTEGMMSMNYVNYLNYLRLNDDMI